MYEKLLRRACGPEARMCLLVAAVVVSDLLFGLTPSWSCAHLIAAGFVGWMAALCAPLFVFGKYSRPFYCLLFSFYLPCRIVCGFVKKNFGMMPGPDTIAILKNSSWAEAKWFVGTYLDIWGLLVSIAVAGCLAAVLFATARLTGRIRGSWRKALLGCLLALVFAGYLSLYRDAKTGVAMSMPTLNLAISCFADGAKFDKLAGMKASPRFPADIGSVAGYEKCTGVFVLVRFARALIAEKLFEAARLYGRLVVSVDGTKVESKRGCPLKGNRKARYALEAKLLTPWGWAGRPCFPPKKLSALSAASA